MRRAVAVAVLLSAVVVAQSLPKPTLSSYVGRWQASFEGKPFFVVTLAQSGDKLSGAIQHTRDIHVNDKGVVDKVVPEMSDEQIVDTKLIGDHLRITGKNDDSQEENVYELQLEPPAQATSQTTVYNSGLLRMSREDMPPNVPMIQPWKVTRVVAK